LCVALKNERTSLSQQGRTTQPKQNGFFVVVASFRRRGRKPYKMKKKQLLEFDCKSAMMVPIQSVICS